MPDQMRGADVLVKTLSDLGVKHLFTLSGNQIMSVFDACIDSGIELIHVRHEAAAVHMADAWGRLTGKPGVALVTAGPGFANCLSALYVAKMAESPLILLSGHASSRERDRGAFQEMGQAAMAHYVAKSSWTVRGGALLAFDFARAWATATTGRPGPVHVSLPVNMLESFVNAVTFRAASPKHLADDLRREWTRLDDFEATGQQILDTIAESERPLILAGPAMSRGEGRKLLSSLSEATRVPAIAMESPRGVNDPSLGALAEVLPQADMIVLVAKQLDFTLQLDGQLVFHRDCRVIQFDPDMEVVELTRRVLERRKDRLLSLLVHYETEDEESSGKKRRVQPALFDPLPTVAWLTGLARQRDWPERDWLEEVNAAISYWPAAWESIASHGDEPLHAARVCREVQQFLCEAEHSVFVSDGGEFCQWAQACINAPHRLINGPSGTIGVAVPFALAARLARPESRIVAMAGDGGFGFHAMEFDTAVRHKLSLIAVVGNDAKWNAEQQIQLHKFGTERSIGCDLLSTSYDQVVQTLGGHGRRVTRGDDLAAALNEAHATGLPSCLNVTIQPAAAPLIRRAT